MSYRKQRESAAYELAIAIDDLIDVRETPEAKLDLRGLSELANEILKFMERWEKAR